MLIEGSSPFSKLLKWLYSLYLSFLLQVLTSHVQTILTIIFHLKSSANNCMIYNFYMTSGPTYFIATLLEAVLNWLVKGDMRYTKSPLLYWNYSLSLLISANHFILKLCRYCSLLFNNVKYAL